MNNIAIKLAIGFSIGKSDIKKAVHNVGILDTIIILVDCFMEILILNKTTEINLLVKLKNIRKVKNIAKKKLVVAGITLNLIIIRAFCK